MTPRIAFVVLLVSLAILVGGMFNMTRFTSTADASCREPATDRNGFTECSKWVAWCTCMGGNISCVSTDRVSKVHCILR